MFSGKYNQSINSILLIAKLCAGISILLGLIVTIIYCGTIDFYPSGLTIGDTLFFISASLAFAVTYTIIVLGTLSAGITISPILRWLQPAVITIINLYLRIRRRKKIKCKLTFPILKINQVGYVLFGSIIVFLTIHLYSKNIEKAINLSWTILIMSFIYGFWNTKPRLKEYNKDLIKKIKLGLAVLAYATPFIIIQAKSNFLNHAMDMIGVRSESNIVQLSKKYTTFLTNNNIQHSKKTTGDEGLYTNVTVLFKGIGDSVVIKIENFVLTVQSKDIIIGQ